MEVVLCIVQSLWATSKRLDVTLKQIFGLRVSSHNDDFALNDVQFDFIIDVCTTRTKAIPVHTDVSDTIMYLFPFGLIKNNFRL